MKLTTCTLAAALLTACSGPVKEETDAGKSSALVHVATVEAGAIPEVVTAYGAAETVIGADQSLAAPVDSTVTRVLVAVGDTVRAGQTVATLQPVPLVTQELAKSSQDLQTSQAALARALRLRAGGLVSDADVETARAAAASARATTRGLRGRLAGALRAPRAGIVQSIPAAPGSVVSAGGSILTLGSATGARIRLGLDPADAPRVHAGDTVHLAALSGGRQADSRIVSVDPRADPQTRQSAAFAAPPTGAPFASGQPVKGDIALARRAGVALVPRIAVLYEGDAPYLFVVAGGVAHRRDIVPGAETADRIEVRRGVRVGERIALDGGTALSDGMAVREAAPR